MVKLRIIAIIVEIDSITITSHVLLVKLWKISVINNEILLPGELKNKMYKNLIDTIILQKSKNIILKTEISIPEDNPINNQQNENSNEEVIKNETLKLPEIQLLINNILKDRKISFE